MAVEQFLILFVGTIVGRLKEDQPLRLLLNLLFYQISRSKPTYKSQRIKLPDETTACNQLSEHVERSFNLGGDLTDHILLKINF